MNEWLGGYAGSGAMTGQTKRRCPVTARKPVNAAATRRCVLSPKPSVRAGHAPTTYQPPDQSRERHPAEVSEEVQARAGRPDDKSAEVISCSRNARQIYLAVAR